MRARETSQKRNKDIATAAAAACRRTGRHQVILKVIICLHVREIIPHK